jgi:hypothetical protein
MKFITSFCFLYLLVTFQVIAQTRKTFPNTKISVEIPDDFELKTDFVGSHFLKNDQYISINYDIAEVPPQTLSNDSALSIFLSHSPQSLQWIKDTIVNQRTCKLAKYSHQALGANKYFLLIPSHGKTYIICGLYYLHVKKTEDNVLNDELTFQIVLTTQIKD